MKDRQAGGGSSIFINPVFWAMALCAAFSAAVFKRYLAGADLPDEGLYRLLEILRCSSFFACVFSVWLLALSVARLIRRPGFLPVLKIILFLITALYGAGFVIFTYIITVIASGNR
jgi:hypothetical protein